jgi:hypothetical protein
MLVRPKSQTSCFRMSFKGTVSRDFSLQVFSWIISPKTPENNIRIIQNFFKVHPISPRIFDKIYNGPKGILRGNWLMKKTEVEILPLCWPEFEFQRITTQEDQPDLGLIWGSVPTWILLFEYWTSQSDLSSFLHPPPPPPLMCISSDGQWMWGRYIFWSIAFSRLCCDSQRRIRLCGGRRPKIRLRSKDPRFFTPE